MSGPERIRITLLGTGTSTGVPSVTCECRVCTSEDPRDKRLRPSVHVEWDGASVLIDTSTDLRQQALRYGIRRVDAVLYTHAHADHILGMDDLRIYNWRQRAPVPLYGSVETFQALRKTFWYVFEDVQQGGGLPAVELNVVDGSFELLGRTVVPVPALHGELPVYGFRIGGFAYLTDLNEIPASSYGLLENLDVLVLDALRRNPHPTHFCLEESVREAVRIGARKTLFTHIAHDLLHGEVTRDLPESVDLAYDGMVIELPEGP
jgi:phosphoribosyl 1,2-cyclic phosphate phosphodiesterase